MDGGFSSTRDVGMAGRIQCLRLRSGETSAAIERTRPARQNQSRAAGQVLAEENWMGFTSRGFRCADGEDRDLVSRVEVVEGGGEERRGKVTRYFSGSSTTSRGAAHRHGSTTPHARVRFSRVPNQTSAVLGITLAHLRQNRTPSRVQPQRTLYSQREQHSFTLTQLTEL